MFVPLLYNAFGLDMSDLSIKAVQLYNTSYLHRVPRFRLGAIHAIELPPGLIVNGELQKPEEIRKAVQELMGGKKNGGRPIKGYWVVASIPESQSFIKMIEIDRTATLTAEAVRELAEQHIPFEENNYYLDWQIMPSDPAAQRIPILLGATPKTVADSYTYLLESLGLGVIALEAESISVARAMITAQKEYGEEARLVLDIGATRTGVIVYDHDMIQFSTTLPFSGELLTTAIMQKNKGSHEDAEHQKKTEGLQYQKGPIWEIIANAVETFTQDIKKTIDFYYSHFPNAHQITHITLCGGAANSKNLDDILSTQVGIPAKAGNPWKNVSPVLKPPHGNNGLSYATAIGLALRAADNPLLSHDSI